MIFKQLTQQLKALFNLLSNLDNQQYNSTIKYLGNSSIGAHARHIIELLQCAVVGYDNGFVDYENRKRNLELETNIDSAKLQLKVLLTQIKKEDKFLYIAFEKNDTEPISTTYFREILYNSEHSIHHLALIKVALIDMELNIVDKNFGLAYSTIKFRNQLIAD